MINYCLYCNIHNQRYNLLNLFHTSLGINELKVTLVKCNKNIVISCNSNHKNKLTSQK